MLRLVHIWQVAAALIARVAMMLVFGMFIYGVGMRYLFDKPQSWVDEAVTILAVWLVFWTAAFVLKWSELISFDILVNAFPRHIQRFLIAASAIAYSAVVGAALYPIIDYVMFMKIMTTDMLLLRLDLVYSIFVVFLIATALRSAVLGVRLLLPTWPPVLADLLDASAEVEGSL
ncbi:TRAP transporter small permease [Jannaschia sp. 2305UL9-9]|uniref:TRAP transporter small permease n=1 Tax=Jannaschia sp. 2305UL9-9 TaxID=3121638 RepID=UPI003528D308